MRLRSDWTFSGGKVLGSMCSAPHPVAIQAATKYIEANIGDAGLVPALVELEREVISILGAWWGRPEASGRVVTGGTEANLLALWSAKAAAPERNEVVLPESAHFSFDKAASLMGLKLVKIPLTEQGTVRVDLLKKALNKRTVAVVGIAGSTALGVVDPLPELAALCAERQLYFHIDASFGGFVLPFLAEAGFPAPEFRWREGVTSVTIDPHKMGRGPIPSGCILWKDEEIARSTAMNVQYLSGGRSKINTIVGTRSGASVAAVWAVLKFLGRAGYVEIVREAMELSTFLHRAVLDVPGVEPVLPLPVLNVVGVRCIKRPVAAVAQILRQKGWALSLWEDFFRIVVMPHVTRPMLKEFLADLQEELK